MSPITKRHVSIRNLSLGLILFSAGCGGPDTLVYRISNESVGEHCEYGGLKIEQGPDKNNSGRLDDNEVEGGKTQFACAVLAEGKTSKVRVTEFATSSECPAGGLKIESGLDTNNSGTLETDEIESTATICNGEDGTDGKNSLIRLTDVPSGSPECTFGGTRLEAGLDSNNDGTLQNSEVNPATSKVVCSIRVIDNVRVEQRVILPGEQGTTCAEGGVRLTAGVDSNENSRLDASEITASVDMCNRIQTVSGRNSLIRTANANATQCRFGGLVVQSGVDDNSSGVLDAAEVDQTGLVCNGANGFDSISEPFDANFAECGAVGGVRFETGLDTNRSGTLEVAEVTSIAVVCNGDVGPQGFDGFNSLITQSADSTVCPFGGVRFRTGLDLDEDGLLDSGEVEFESVLCDGQDGLTPVIVPEERSDICDFEGGVLLHVGYDTNGDGVIGNSEFFGEPAVVCNGLSGYIVDINNPVESFVCPDGGVKILTGVDFNLDGELSGSEIADTQYVCNGAI